MRISIEPRLYFFKSPYQTEQRPVTECLIMAHGATYEASLGFFQAPPGLTLHFFIEPGVPLPSPDIANLVRLDTHKPGLDLKFPWTCPNYSLSKVLSGEEIKKDYKALHREELTYSGLEAFLDVAKMGVEQRGYGAVFNGDRRWCPHVVVVRNRGWGYGKTITLLETITAIRQHDKKINDISLAACRVHKLAGHVNADKTKAPKPTRNLPI